MDSSTKRRLLKLSMWFPRLFGMGYAIVTGWLIYSRPFWSSLKHLGSRALECRLWCPGVFLVKGTQS